MEKETNKETNKEITNQNSESWVFNFSLSPQDILNMIASSYNGIPIKVKGIVKNENGFWRLIDKRGTKISLEKVDIFLKEESFLEIEGILRCHIQGNYGGIYPRIEVRKVHFQKEEILESYENRIQELLRGVKKERGFFDYFEKVLIKALEEERKLVISVIHGRNAQTHIDFEKGLRSSLSDFYKILKLYFKEVTLRIDSELAQAIRECSRKSEAIFIVRGGGNISELEEIGGIETIQAIMESPIPVYVALGHSLDKNVSLLEKVAEHSFATPSLAGVELGKVLQFIMSSFSYETLVKEHFQSQGILTTLKEENKKLATENKNLKDKNRTYFIIIAVLVGLLVFLFLRN